MKLPSKPAMIFTLPALLVLAALGVSFITNSNAQTPEPAGTYPADHIIRITALLEFDGKPVVVDELITCLAEGAGGSTSGRQFLSFQPNRILVAVDTPDGGMIKLSTMRSFCYVYGSTWGGQTEERTVPENWTPPLTWYDNRNPREWDKGIMYISETALTAENGRLRIIEDFEITIPEHPFSDALLAEAEAQEEERDFWQGVPPNVSDIFLVNSRMGTMIEVPEDMWRNPDPRRLRDSIHASRDTDPQPLIDFLDSLGNGDKIIAVPFYVDPDGGPDSATTISEEARRMIGAFEYGQRPSLGKFLERGIPKSNAERFGLLISENTATRYQNIPLDLNRLDTRIPWKCEGGVAMPDFDNPGLIYLFSQRCTHPNYFEQLVWPEYGEVENWRLFYGGLFFDQKTKTFWFYR